MKPLVTANRKIHFGKMFDQNGFLSILIKVEFT